MAWIPGGSFVMGSSFADYPEEHPERRVSVDGFWIDHHPVTVREFSDFVAATGYRTVAERPLDPEAYPDLDATLLNPGSLVFQPPAGPVDLTNIWNWWTYVPGASWQHPAGPDSTVTGREDHPVVHVAFEDIEAYAAWAGKAIPTEAEWECAARGGLEGQTYTWGTRFTIDGQYQANTWQGKFPHHNTQADGFYGTSPVGSYAPNGYGLHDMAGNVWEWTSDYYAPSHRLPGLPACCVPANPRVLSPEHSYDPADRGAGHIPRKVIKGGSHLCAPNYCWRYRPAARQAQMVDSGMAHLGFRCILHASSADSVRRSPESPTQRKESGS